MSSLFKAIGTIAGAAIGFATSGGNPAGALKGATIGSKLGGAVSGSKKSSSSSSTSSGPSLTEQLNASKAPERKKTPLAPTKIAKTGAEAIKDFQGYDPTKTMEDPWEIANQWDEDLGGHGNIDFERFT